ncbi:MAG TPA: type V CRISPR-associated protein Cas12k [Coleofasciculaceae cyanobacterium]|jgi:IS605 OrfB family transposase
MTEITIQCRLTAPEDIRHKLWLLMAEKNTPLINELFKQLAEHPDLEIWKQKGKLPRGLVKNLCQPLKEHPKYKNQPGRFYSSAIAMVDFVYKSWLKVRKGWTYELRGQERWLAMLKSDDELFQEYSLGSRSFQDRSLEDIKGKATEIIYNLKPDEYKSTHSQLFALYDDSEDVWVRCAIVHLLKNGCKVRQKLEDPEKFAKRRRKVEIRIERLTKKLNGKAPQGRDLTGQKWLDTLAIASTYVPQDDAQAKLWQDILLTQSKSVPYPVNFLSNEDTKWGKNEKDRLIVKFNGLEKYIGKHCFQIYCDKRQLSLFQLFYDEQELKKQSNNTHSGALLALRSSRMIWKEGNDKGKPWNVNHLTLHCFVDTLLLTTEGSDLIRQKKAETFHETLQDLEQENLNPKQQALVKKTKTSLDRINNSYSLPHKPLYQGQTNILLGVAIQLEKPATVAIVDGKTSKAITYRSTKQLLGKDYRLLNRQRQQKHFLAHKRNVAQRHHADNRFGESELGQYIDRLLAKAVIKLAKEYRAGCIVVPRIKNKRDIIQAEVQAKAEAKIPGCIEKQKKYAKKYRTNIHQWSYGRLIDNIKSQAAKAGIKIKEGKQSIRGSPTELAKKIAIDGY